MAPTLPPHTRVNQSGINPSVRLAGIYQLNCEELAGTCYCNAYRNGRMLTTVRARTAELAVSQARRNVRMARKAGGL